MRIAQNTSLLRRKAPPGIRSLCHELTRMSANKKYVIWSQYREGRGTKKRRRAWPDLQEDCVGNKLPTLQKDLADRAEDKLERGCKSGLLQDVVVIGE